MGKLCEYERAVLPRDKFNWSVHGKKSKGNVDSVNYVLDSSRYAFIIY